MSDILERLRETPTVTLPQAEALLPVASTIRQMMVERAEAADTIAALLEALKLAREYVAKTHAVLASASGMTENLVSPDLTKIDDAIALASPSTQTGGEG